jgi:hypothetical protein
MNARTMLLTAILFTAPCSMVVAEDTTLTTATTPTTGTLAKLGGLVTAPFVAAGNGAGWIADKSCLNQVIALITETKYLKDTRINNPALIGKTIVSLAALFAAYKLYIAYTEAQDADAGDDDAIFYEESN